jgi:acyl carrier protein
MVETKVKEIIAEQLNISIDQIKSDSRLMTDFGMDSLDAVEIILSLEDAFGVEIPEEEKDNFSTVKDIITYIERKVL